MHYRQFIVALVFGMLGGVFANSILFAQTPKEITNSIGMKLVLIPKGKFQMGSPPGKIGLNDESQHEVTLSRDFYLGIFEVTQAQYREVMKKNPSYFQKPDTAERQSEAGDKIEEVDCSNHPVERISWDDAVQFCEQLSQLPEERDAGRVYRLPTEAEWEYACRAGSTRAFSFGQSSESLGDYAWYQENSSNKTHPVGQKKPNAWGLYG